MLILEGSGSFILDLVFGQFGTEIINQRSAAKLQLIDDPNLQKALINTPKPSHKTTGPLTGVPPKKQQLSGQPKPKLYEEGPNSL